MEKIHTFDNGVNVYDSHLTDGQRERYRHCNVHEEDEEPVFLAAIGTIPEGGVYVSVGTAIGYYPILAKTKRPDLQIACFEPLPRHARRMRENVALNGFSGTDIRLFECAVSDQEGTVLFRDHAFGSSLVTRKKFSRTLRKKIKSLFVAPREDERDIFVQSLPLIKALNMAELSRVDLLQMDIQGAELTVMKKFFADLAGKPSPVQSFIVGTHGEEAHAGCRDQLKAHGFTFELDELETQHQPDGILLAHC